MTTYNLSQDIIFGASKRCTPNEPYSVACYTVPDSPLPQDLYGNNTDTVIGYNTWSSLRQRYLNSGVAIGPIDSMQIAFGQAEKKLASQVHEVRDDGSGESDGQATWNMVFGEQECQREVFRRKHLKPAALKKEQEQRRLHQPSTMEGTIIDDPINPPFWHETMKHGSGREYEYGIGLDYWSKLTQQTSNSEGDIKFLYFNGSDIQEQLGKPSAFACPSRVKGRLPDDTRRAGLQETRIIPNNKEISWSDLPLYTNICLDTIPVVIHHDGERKDASKNMWKELWFNHVGGISLKDEILREPDRTFAMADGQALTWRELCPMEMDAEVFTGSELYHLTTRCNPDDTFVLGEGTEHIEHRSEGSLWPYQVFKSSPFRPPVLKIKQASNAKLAPGLLFITLYHTKAPLKIKMPGPIIFTDQGRLIWFGPIGNTANFKWQEFSGKPTLLFWMRDGPAIRGHGYGNITLLEQDYSVKTVLCPQHGINTAKLAKPHCEADLHEARIVLSRNTIITTAYNATSADLSSIHGPIDGWIWDSQFCEIDPISKTVLFQWRASDHIPLTESRKEIRDQGSLARPYDFFHINSVVDIGDDYYLLSSRHCWTIYLIDKQGNVVWRFSGDGKGSDFGDLPPEAQFRWQHDARPHNVGDDHLDISVFDNQNWDIRQKESKSASKLLVFRLPMTPSNAQSQVQVLNIIRPQMDCQSVSQGAFDNNLPNGNKLATWGNIPILTEFDSSGKEMWSAEFGRAGEVHIYRGFKQEWHATPYTRPDLFVEKDGGSAYRGHVSWNGATDIEGWNVYAGLSTDSVEHLGRVENRGFETKFNLPCWTRFAQAGAIEQGREVRRSKFFQV